MMMMGGERGPPIASRLQKLLEEEEEKQDQPVIMPRTSSSWEKASFPYAVDYNDHFETPIQAYRDIAPLIDWIHHPNSTSTSTTNTTPTLYDPYYCNGRSAVLLQSLGYQVQHAKRDFYKDIRCNCVPHYDVLVTNPPYSDQHKQTCLEYCASSLQQHNRSFFLLMPSYVTSRAYYRTFLDQNNLHDHMLYVAPQIEYQYEHPEGTGHESSPFASLWICGMTLHNRNTILSKWNNVESLEQHDNNHNRIHHNYNTLSQRPNLYRSVQELEGAGLISTQKRPNPRQRRKKRSRPEEEEDNSESAPPGKKTNRRRQKKYSTLAAPTPTPSSNLPTSRGTTTLQQVTTKSKYRDETGKRCKKRF